MKQNRTSDFQRSITLIQRRTPTLKQRRNNVVQRKYNVVLTQSQRCKSCIETSRVIGYEFVYRLIIFVLLNEKICFTIYY